VDRPKPALPGLIVLLAFLALAPVLSAIFEPPGENERLRALGNLFELPENVRPLFQPDADFVPVRPPGPSDWLTLHTEKGQEFAEYREFSARAADATRRVIYLLPLGDFPEETSPSFEELRAYTAAFYQLEVRLLPAYYPHDLEFSPRKNPRSGQRQILTTDVMQWLKSRRPADACCLLAVTMQDLYPRVSWNYVFGQASIDERVGIFSLARYDPAFWGDERGRDFRTVILQRSCKVLVHETAHMFGLHHCVYFSCVVNGSNHMVETDRQPQALCPVCLRKLRFATGLDPIKRYEDLARFYRRQKWFEDLDLVNRQLARLPKP
jgi:archaemetzincin